MIAPLTAEKALFVVTNADEMGKKELKASFGADYEPGALRSIALQDHQWVYERESEPVAVILGRYYADGDVYVPWLIKTPKFPRISSNLTRFVKNTIIDTVADSPASRAESFSLAENVKSHGWLRLLGAKPVEYHPGFGRQGEDVIRWRWTRDDVSRWRRGRGS